MSFKSDFPEVMRISQLTPQQEAILGTMLRGMMEAQRGFVFGMPYMGPYFGSYRAFRWGEPRYGRSNGGMLWDGEGKRKEDEKARVPESPYDVIFNPVPEGWDIGYTPNPYVPNPYQRGRARGPFNPYYYFLRGF